MGATTNDTRTITLKEEEIVSAWVDNDQGVGLQDCQACDTCAWFEPEGAKAQRLAGNESTGPLQPGDCRVGPPGMNGWPRVWEDQYCGRYCEEDDE